MQIISNDNTLENVINKILELIKKYSGCQLSDYTILYLNRKCKKSVLFVMQ